MFRVGDYVTVRESKSLRHVRTPAYVQGRSGTVLCAHGKFPNPEERAYGRPGTPVDLYSVAFKSSELWDSPSRDEVIVDIYENWLMRNENWHA